MKALITGASSGIGRELARQLAAQGCDLILVARRTQLLEQLAAELPVSVRVCGCDLSSGQACRELYEQTAAEGVDIVINNAGFGLLGPFSESSLERELDMIRTNIDAVHILTKLFLADMRARNGGYILNVASSAAFLPGPLLATYYATKAYVLRLSQAVAGELRAEGSRVYVGALCPGPVRTGFDEVAGVRRSLRGMSAETVARAALRGMRHRRTVITPGVGASVGRIAARLLPDGLLLRFAYKTQRKKLGE